MLLLIRPTGFVGVPGCLAGAEGAAAGPWARSGGSKGLVVLLAVGYPGSADFCT